MCSCAIVSCGSFTETKKQLDQAAALLEKDLGAHPFMGFHLANGKLVTVTVVFQDDELKDMPFSELELHVHQALASTLTQKPDHVIVSLRSQGLKTDNKRPNQAMKPTAPRRNAFSMFATTPCRGLSLSR
jgi:hypothetical protein